MIRRGKQIYMKKSVTSIDSEGVRCELDQSDAVGLERELELAASRQRRLLRKNSQPDGRRRLSWPPNRAGSTCREGQIPSRHSPGRPFAS